MQLINEKYKPDTDVLVKGEMPKRALRLIFEWLEYHKQELMNLWNRAQKGEPLSKVEPLK